MVTAFQPTERQLSILRLLCQGWENKEIAAALGIGVDAVVDHLHRMCDRSGCRDRVQLAAFAVERGLATSGIDYELP